MNSGSGELVEIGVFVILRALAAQVGPAEIVEEEDDEVGIGVSICGE